MSNNDNSEQLFIGNLSYDATEGDIEIACGRLNIQIGEIRIVRDRDTGRAKGFAFIDIRQEEPLSLAEIVSCVDGLEILDRPVRASIARPRPEPGAKGADRNPNNRRHTKRDAGGSRAPRERQTRSGGGRRMGASVWDD